MSVIAQKKIQQRKGPEDILVFMGYTFIAVDLILTILFFIFKWNFGYTFMIPIMYFLLNAGICFSFGAYLKSSGGKDFSKVKNWVIGYIVIGIVFAVVLSSYVIKN